MCVDVDEWVEMQKRYRESKELLFELKSQLLGLRPKWEGKNRKHLRVVVLISRAHISVDWESMGHESWVCREAPQVTLGPS